ncbi:MAG: hypothetical protein JWP69_2268 [Flaviaesturariibacter sp.]|nr:hypothetical protein [Flaviaesturariibacter sp.]
MAFEIVERLFAIEAAVHGFAGRGSELADEFRVIRMAARTFDSFFREEIVGTNLLLWIGRRDPESL